MDGNGLPDLVDLARQDVTIIPPAFKEILAAMMAVDPKLITDGDRTSMDDTIDSLTPEEIEVVKTLAALAELRQAASTTFSEWLATQEAQRTSHSFAVAQAMRKDQNWPRRARTYPEFHQYIATKHPDLLHALDTSWDRYRAQHLDQHGDSGTIQMSVEYAASISWRDGTDQIIQETQGTERYTAQAAAERYNDRMTNRTLRKDTDPVPGSQAIVVRRTVVSGPWYAI